jgi:hypothetical protein
MLVRLDQLADFQRRMAAKRGYVLAGHRGVTHALCGLFRIQPMIGMRAWPKTISE